jgi:hypothetical protein
VIEKISCSNSLTVTLFPSSAGISSGERKVIEKISYVTSAIFIAEMVFKIWGLSLGGYFSVGQNCFDGLIVLLTLVELFLSSEKLKVKLSPLSGLSGS